MKKLALFLLFICFNLDCTFSSVIVDSAFREQVALNKLLDILVTGNLPKSNSSLFDIEDFTKLVGQIDTTTQLYTNGYVCLISDAVDKPFDEGIGISAMNSAMQLKHRKKIRAEGVSTLKIDIPKSLKLLSFEKFAKMRDSAFFIVTRHHLLGVNEFVVEFNVVSNKMLDDIFYYTFQLVLNERFEISDFMMFAKSEFDFDCIYEKPYKRL